MSTEKKIYTKGGDTGTTSLLGGSRVSKSHEQVEAYGTIDELASFTGLLRDQEISSDYKAVLLKIQEQLFVAETWIAADREHSHDDLPPLQESIITLLEKEIDQMTDSLPLLDHFILPGGHQAVSLCHVARTVCRRAERSILRIQTPGPGYEVVIRFMNRLSDYFFVLSRKIALEKGAKEMGWKP